VVWARDMGPEKNRELLDYYKDRRAWLVEPDEKPPGVILNLRDSTILSESNYGSGVL